MVTFMKKIKTIICVVLTIALLSTSAFALTTINLIGISTNDYSWSPVDVYARTSFDNGQFRVVSYFKWDSTNVNTVIDPVNDLYYTMDHYLYEDNGITTLDDLYTNVPYALFDIEDDEKNNYTEELEVSCYSAGNSSPFAANLYYFFDTTWHNYASPTNMTCYVRSQKSMYAILTGEMQAHYTEYHGNTPTYLIGTDTSSTNNEVTLTETSSRVLVVPSKEEIAATSNPDLAYQALVNDATSAEEVDVLERASVVVTFDTPLAQSEVVAIIQNINASIEYCTLKFEDANGMRITGWTDDISSDHLQKKLQYLQEEHGDISFTGIVSADITMDLTDKAAYAALANNASVYYVDISDPVTRIAEKDYTGERDIVVMDASWLLEE